MAIKKEDLTEEQKATLKKLYKKYCLNIALASALYFGFLFFANFSVILVDALYVHNAQFRFLMTFGSAFIAMLGWSGTIKEKREVLIAQVKEQVGDV